MKIYFQTALLGLITAVLIGVAIIPALKRLKFGQNILSYVKEHDYKSGTPTMGGIIFMLSAFLAFLCFSSGKRSMAFVCLAVSAGYMIVGGIDDFIKIRLKRNEGLNPLQKTLFELAISLIMAFYAQKKGLTTAYLPFADKTVDLGLWHFPLCVFVFIATTNSVNLTDGLDGLAGGVSYVYFAFIGLIIYVQTTKNPARYVNLSEYENLITLSSATVGSLIGFLFFNTFKASVFMGDTGSLALGGLVASVSLVSGNMFFIPIIGIMFVISSISVILQVARFKRTGERIFLMAPLHHHFQHKGYSESKIAFIYKAITLVLGGVCVISCL